MQHADRSTASLVEAFRNMHIEEDEHLENGGLDYEVEVHFFPSDICIWFWRDIFSFTFLNTSCWVLKI